MLQSMTGYARLEDVEGNTGIVWQLKSVNHRYLEVHFRLPEGMGELEGAARKRLQAIFSRGHLECSLTLRRGGDPNATLALNMPLLEGILALEGRLRARLGEGRGAGLAIDRLLAWPGMVQETTGDAIAGDPISPLLMEALLALLEKTARGLEAMRRREGVVLTGLLQKQLGDLELLVAQVEERLPEVRQALETRLRQRLTELGDAGVEPSRLAQEIVFYLHRLDVAEEVDRLRLHVREMRSILAGEGPAGRRLDFLCQELHREANTLGSKSQDGQLARLGVDMKVLIEKLREQIQNLE
ncbi:MAG: YicC family protein [Magnetococcales bacterium]|nr:YicC family protein [Magnetococcales bacterium]